MSADEIFVVVLLMLCAAVIAVIAIRSRQQQHRQTVDAPAVPDGSQDATSEMVGSTVGANAPENRRDG